MQMTDMQESLERIEQCADDAVAAVRSGKAPDELRQVVQQLHQQARELRNMSHSSNDEQQLASRVESLEQLGDRAKDACENAGEVDPQLKEAITRAHDELSSLKHQLQ